PAVIVVAAHLDARGAGEAVDYQLHDGRGLAELVTVRTTGVELGIREDTTRAYDHRVFGRVKGRSTEAVRDVRGLEVAAPDHVFHDFRRGYLLARFGNRHLLVAQAIDRFHDGGGVIRPQNADEFARVHETGNVARPIHLG